MEVKKLIDFKGKNGAIQSYANKHCDGNFSRAVRKLVNRSLDLDSKLAGKKKP